MTIQEQVMQKRIAAGLRVLVYGLPGRTTPFDYYAKEEAKAQDFERRYTTAGYRTERA